MVAAALRGGGTMNAPFRSLKSDSSKLIVATTDDIRLFWLQVVADMNLQPGISPGSCNPDRLSTEAWR
jgi:hypothetical protein